MNKIFASLDNSQNDEEVIVSCLDLLREISTQEYEYVQYYFKKICEVTYICSKNDSPKVGAQSFEFWTTLIEDETERIEKNVACQHYVGSCKENLINMILGGLNIITFEEDDDVEEWGHAMSAGICLQKLALLLKNDVMQQVVGFAAANL